MLLTDELFLQNGGILGSSMENRSPFQESTFVLEETGVMELLKG